jgi:hypothetical protein
MRIIVCMKQVLDLEKIRIKSETHGPVAFMMLLARKLLAFTSWLAYPPSVRRYIRAACGSSSCEYPYNNLFLINLRASISPDDSPILSPSAKYALWT